MRCHFKELLSNVDDKNMKGALKLFEYHIRTKNLTPKTISVYGERLGYFCRYLRENNIPFEKVSKHTIQDYILLMQTKPLAAISINGRIKILKIFYKFLKAEGLIDEDPAEKTPLMRMEKRFKPILSEQNIEQLLSVPIRKYYTGMRNFCMILVFYDTLIRLTELINIRLRDVDLDSGTIKVFGKGRKERIVPIGAKTCKYLHRFIVFHRKDIQSEYVFCTMRGMPLDQRNILRILERIGDRVGVHVSPHLIRHSAASHRAMAGMPAFLLQKLLGHTTIQMTEKYVHLVDNEKLKAAFRQFSPLDAIKV